ncbi:MAG: energy transducer TonB family protein [Bacteroidota bacterium]
MGDLLWEHRFGVFGVLILHFGFFVYANIKTIHNMPVYVSVLQPETRIEMDFSQVPDPIVPPKEEVLTDAYGNVINKTFNESDSRDGSAENYDSRFDKSAVDEEVYNNLKNLEKSTFSELESKKGNKNTATNPENTTTKTKNKTEEDENSNVNPTSSGGMKGRAVASYYLPMRRDEKLPPPAYRCMGSGVVVLNVEVSLNGNVISAEIDRKKSSYKDECLAVESMEYVKKAKFTASSMADNPQKGTITYTFIGQ